MVDPTYDIIFFLIPHDKDENAKQSLEIEQNKKYIYEVNGKRALGVGFCFDSSSSKQIASIGRSSDLRLHSDSISKKHAAFTFDAQSDAIFLSSLRDGRDDPRMRVICREAPDQPTKLPVHISYAYSYCITFNDEKFFLEWNKRQYNDDGTLSNEQDKVIDLERRVSNAYAVAVAREYDATRSRQRTVEDCFTNINYRITRIPRNNVCVYKGYTVRGSIGQGSFGNVFKAIEATVGQAIAVKSIEASSDTAKQLARREIAIHSSLHHENIARFYGSDYCDNEARIFMYLYRGSLSGIHLDYPELDKLLHQMLQGLQYLHGKNIIHQDIKPDNVMWTIQEGGSRLYVLSDFGLASYLSPNPSRAGTPVYQPPEYHVDQGKRGTSGDIYATFVTIGAVSLCGFNPLKCKSFAMLMINVGELANHARLSVIAAMARFNPRYRPTANQCLETLYGTHEQQFPAVPEDLVEICLPAKLFEPFEETKKSMQLGEQPRVCLWMGILRRQNDICTELDSHHRKQMSILPASCNTLRAFLPSKMPQVPAQNLARNPLKGAGFALDLKLPVRTAAKTYTDAGVSGTGQLLRRSARQRGQKGTTKHDLLPQGVGKVTRQRVAKKHEKNDPVQNVTLAGRIAKGTRRRIGNQRDNMALEKEIARLRVPDTHG